MSLSPPLQLPVAVSFFSDTPTTGIYTLSLHDALPIFDLSWADEVGAVLQCWFGGQEMAVEPALQHGDRKSTRLNSSHANITYPVSRLQQKHLSKPIDEIRSHHASQRVPDTEAPLAHHP